jgi:hypothetical protein
VAHADVIHSRLIERREPSDWRYPLDLVRLGHNSSRS